MKTLTDSLLKISISILLIMASLWLSVEVAWNYKMFTTGEPVVTVSYDEEDPFEN
jgi:hypothetical protein